MYQRRIVVSQTKLNRIDAVQECPAKMQRGKLCKTDAPVFLRSYPKRGRHEIHQPVTQLFLKHQLLYLFLIFFFILQIEHRSKNMIP